MSVPSDYPGHEWDPNYPRYTREETALYFCHKWEERHQMTAAQRAEVYYYYMRCIVDETARTKDSGYIPRSGLTSRALPSLQPQLHRAPLNRDLTQGASRGHASGNMAVANVVPLAPSLLTIPVTPPLAPDESEKENIDGNMPVTTDVPPPVISIIGHQETSGGEMLDSEERQQKDKDKDNPIGPPMGDSARKRARCPNENTECCEDSEDDVRIGKRWALECRL